MTTPTQQKVLAYIRELIEQANQVVASQYSRNNLRWVDTEKYSCCRSECLNLVRMLGEPANVWKDSFTSDKSLPSNAKTMLGTLKGIENAVMKGMLDRIEDLSVAETMGGLIEQAEHLLLQKYHIAAGVLGRAVLEQHLRKSCDHKGCSPAKPKPTINDLTDALYTAKHLTLTEKKFVESMAAVGNDAAHNKDSLKREDVERMIPDVRRFLVQHPVS
jgi:hypothetical protein